MMLYCLLFVKSFAVHEIQTHEQLPPSYIFKEPLEFFQAIMVALEKFFALHLVQILPISHTFLYCNLPWEIHNDKKIDTSLCIDPFFLAIRAWKMIDRFSKNLQLQGKGDSSYIYNNICEPWSQVATTEILRMMISNLQYTTSLLFHLLNIGQMS